ncbi:MAG: c-type cytochrome [Novosphingobium sp.]|nr:c-type cytochrome [Novosphingobium sp.]MCP5402522.1 c-type cytochrome [Novosphingobium sp.]
MAGFAIAVAGIVLALSGFGPDAASAAQPGSAKNERPDAFKLCMGCHSTEPGKHIFGPSLAGIAGRKAGSLPGFSYSSALKNSGLTWNEANLERWLTSPQKTVPGTRMPFTGISDPAKRQEVVRYLLTLQ